MRRREKADYTAHLADKGLYAILAEGVSPPVIDKGTIGVLKKLSRLAFRLVKARAAKTEASAREARLKGEIDSLLNFLEPLGIIGLSRQAGPETSTELKRVEVYGREVKDSMLMLDWLGDHASEVVKAVHLPLHFMIEDPDKFKQALSYLSGLYGQDLQKNLQLDVHIGRIDKLVKDGSLGEEPAGLWKNQPKSSRIDAKLL